MGLDPLNDKGVFSYLNLLFNIVSTMCIICTTSSYIAKRWAWGFLLSKGDKWCTQSTALEHSSTGRCQGDGCVLQEEGLASSHDAGRPTGLSLGHFGVRGNVARATQPVRSKALGGLTPPFCIAKQCKKGLSNHLPSARVGHGNECHCGT